VPIYLDHAATTPEDRAVREVSDPYRGDSFGNPSSRHAGGVRAAEALDRARAQVARALGARPEGVVFTSGGTEANNLAVLGLARAAGKRGGHILLGPTEHPSVRAPAQALAEEGFEVELLRLDGQGELDLEDAARRLRAETVLVAQMLVQNEVGTIHPVARLARLVRARAPRARLHVDAVQACGKLACALDELGVDSLSISAHKLGGPQGSGALVLRQGVEPRPLLLGGGQERGLRSGTQNVAGAVGLGAALERAEASREVALEHFEVLRRRFLFGLEQIPGARALAAGTRTAPWIVAVELAGPPAEVHMHHLESRGVWVSAGSACQAVKGELSPTWAVLGLGTDAARRVLRFSFGRGTTVSEIDAALEALAAVERELTTLQGGRVAR
jgi:cysteine desulfurase